MEGTPERSERVGAGRLSHRRYSCSDAAPWDQDEPRLQAGPSEAVVLEALTFDARSAAVLVRWPPQSRTVSMLGTPPSTLGDYKKARRQWTC